MEQFGNVVWFAKPGFDSIAPNYAGDVASIMADTLNVNLVSHTQLEKFVSFN
jgi:hypothetical protein